MVSLANVLTSIFAGFVIFAYLGYLSYITGQDVENVVSEGECHSFVKRELKGVLKYRGKQLHPPPKTVIENIIDRAISLVCYSY
jgi:hypothetical protein